MSTVELVAPTRPSVDDVAAILRARTKTQGGQEEGTFTNQTRPTAMEVQRLIQLAEGDVLAQVGSRLISTYAIAATSAIALRAACLVELSYWPEQVRSNLSPYDQLWRMYEQGLAGLLTALEEAPGGEIGPAPGKGYALIPVVAWTRLEEYEVPVPELP